MRTKQALLAVGMTATAMITAPAPSRAENGQIAAGIIGGLAVGTILGAAVAQPRYEAPSPCVRRSTAASSAYLLLDTERAGLGRRSGRLGASASPSM
jgi:hypothetical protein